MTPIEITFRGRIPSKKNSKFIVTTKKGYSMPITGAGFKKWEKDAMFSVAIQMMAIRTKLPIVQCTVSIEVMFPDARRRDLSNVCEGIMDVLVTTGVLIDDNWRVVNKLELIAIGSDKDKAGAVVRIYPVGAV